MQFTPPGRQARQDAIGPVAYLQPAIRRLLDPSGFEPMNQPGPNDWLALNPEQGQTSAEFMKSYPNFPDSVRRTLYLQPLDEFHSEGPPLSRLQAFTEVFFSMRVRILPVLPLKGIKITSRINDSTGKPQLLTGDVLNLLKQRLPKDAYCLLGITLHDLYPGPEWNFVFGQASFRDRVGVYSFVRYDPRFLGEDAPNRDQLILRRSCKVLAHETGHMFGIAHCIYFRCVMNGSNHLPETDSRPMHLCPVDLRKLYESVRFDPVARYAHLRDFCREVGFNDEAAWIDTQLARVSGLKSQ
jgi:archaemetzincin